MKPTEIYCNKCETTKPESEFYPYCINMDYLTGKCKACRRATNAAWLKRNPDVQAVYTKQARKRDPEKHKKLNQKIYQNMKARGTRRKRKDGHN